MQLLKSLIIFNLLIACLLGTASKGDSYFEEGNYSKALKEYYLVWKEQPENNIIKRKINYCKSIIDADLSYKEGNYKKAENLLKNIPDIFVKEKKDNINKISNLKKNILNYQKELAFEKAIEQVNSILYLNPDDPHCKENKHNLKQSAKLKKQIFNYAEKGKFKIALDKTKELSKIVSTNSKTLNKIAFNLSDLNKTQSLLEQSQYQQLKNIYLRATQIFPESNYIKKTLATIEKTALLEEKGDIYLTAKNYAKAIKNYQAAYKLNPYSKALKKKIFETQKTEKNILDNEIIIAKKIIHHRKSGLLKYSQKKYILAKQDFEKVLQYSPHDNISKYYLKKCQQKINN